MKTKNVITGIVALLAVFSFLSVATVCASDAKKAPVAPGEAVQHAKIQKIDINEADLTILSTLKGIGPETAQNIINYRTEVGSFRKAEDLLSVKGIGEETLKAISPFIEVK